MYDLKQLEKDKIELQEKLRNLNKTKLKDLIKTIIILSLATFIIPFIPLRGSGKNMSTLMGTEKSILWLGIFFTVVLISGVIVKFYEYKKDKFDIKNKIKRVENKIANLKK